jgi:hypothetical protein
MWWSAEDYAELNWRFDKDGRRIWAPCGIIPVAALCTLCRYRHKTHWSWESSACASFIIDALKDTKSEEWSVMAKSLRGRSIASPFSPDGKLTLRVEDGTLVGYEIGCGHNIPQFPYIEAFVPTKWDEIFEAEKDYNKRHGYV